MEEHLREIRKLIDKWIGFINIGNLDEVVALYAFNAVLIPTLKQDTRIGHVRIRDYFNELIVDHKPNVSLTCSNVRIYGDIGINSGDYIFKVKTRDNPIKARFTFVYHWSGDQWLIVEHHSSEFPKEVMYKGQIVDQSTVDQLTK